MNSLAPGPSLRYSPIGSACVRPARTQAQIRQDSDGNERGLYDQQLLDERMPVMTYYAVDDPRQVSEGDRDRLTFVDAAGPHPYPYQEEFLRQHRDRHSYTRFAHYETHYFCSGYGFTILGKADDLIYGTVLPEHFSHHYFCLGLIAHYQKAALLYFADELSSSLKDLSGKPISAELSSWEFRDHVEEIQHRFLKFRTRSFFSEVSNQLQGRELFQLWYENLETDRLFDLVDTTSERLTSVLAERESRQLARVANASVPWFVGLAVASCLFGATSFIKVGNWGNPPDWTFWLIVLASLATVPLSRFVLREGFDVRHRIKSCARWLKRMPESLNRKEQ